MEYCPDCCDPLKPQSKKLGQFSKWLVCPKCGYRKRPKGFMEKASESERFYENKDVINSLWLKEDE